MLGRFGIGTELGYDSDKLKTIQRAGESNDKDSGPKIHKGEDENHEKDKETQQTLTLTMTLTITLTLTLNPNPNPNP